MRPKKLKTLWLLLFAMSFASKINAQALLADFTESDTLVCIGTNVDFTDLTTGGTSPYTWLWDFGDGNTSTAQHPSYGYTAGGIYKVVLTVTDNLLNTSSDSVTIYIIEALVNTSVVRVCSPTNTTTISAVSPIDSTLIGQWFSGGSATVASSLNDTTVVNNLANGLNLFFWIVSSATCSDASQVAVYKDAPVVANAGPDQQVCSSTATATMAGSNPAPGTGLWTTTSAATITSPTIRNTTISGLNIAGNYDFVWTSTNGSCVTTDTMRIVVYNLISAGPILDQTICSVPGTATLIGNNPAPGSGGWTTTGIGIIVPPNSSLANVSGLTVGGVETFIYTITNGACISRDTVLITVNSVVVAAAGSDMQVCSSTATATINGNNPAPGSGNWTTTSAATITTPSAATTGVTGLSVPGNYFFVWTITNGSCVSRDTLVIIVRDPVISDAGPDQSFCSTTSTSLAGNNPAPAVGTWTKISGATITTLNSPTSTVTNLDFGDNYFIWTLVYGACVTRDTVKIHVDRRFDANAGPDKQLCSLTSTTMAANSSQTGVGTWTTTSTAVITNPIDSFTTITGLSIGTSQFVWTIVNGLCTSRDTMNIVVSSLDTARAGGDKQVCSTPGIVTNLNGNIPLVGTGLWTTTSTATITSPTINNSGITGLTTAGPSYFVWTITNGACISRDTMRVTVSTFIASNAGPDQQLCAATMTTLAGNNPGTGVGTWSTLGLSTITTINNPATTVTGLSLGAETFIWEIVSGVCISCDTMIITVSALDTSHAGNDQSVCSSIGTTNLAGNTPITGTGLWTTTSSATFVNASNPTSTVNGLTTAGVYNFEWTITNGSCVSRDTVSITVFNSQVADAGPDQQLCQMSSTTMVANAPTAGTGTWTTASAATITAINNPATTVTGLTVGTYDFIWTITNGGCSSSDTVTIIIDSLVIADAGIDQQICSSDGTATLAANTPSVGTGFWITTSSGTINDPLDPNSGVTGLNTPGVFEFIWMINSGTCLSMDTMLITVDDSIVADAGVDQDYCETDPVIMLNATAPSLGFGVWISLGSASADDPLDPTSTVSGSSIGVNSFVWMVGSGVCLSTDTTDINIYAQVTSNAGPDQQLCVSTGTITLAGNDPAPGTGVWTTNSGGAITISSDSNSTVTGLNTSGVYEFYWTVTNGACSAVDTMVLTVDALVTANAGIDHSLCASLSTIDTLYGNSPLTGTGIWSTTSAAVIGIPTDSITDISGIISGTYQFVYTITNGLCISTDTVTIVADSIVVADAGIDQQVCASPGITNLSGSDPTPGSSFWFTTSSATIANASLSNSAVSGLNSGGVYDFIYTTVNGACLSTDTMVILVDDSVAPNAGPDQNLCETITATNLGATPASIGTGFWVTSSSATVADPLDPASAVTGLTLGAHEFVWFINNGLCLSTDTMYIYVDSSATPANAGNDVVVCASQSSVALNGNTPTTGVGAWSTTGSAIISNPADTLINVSGLTVGINTFIWTITNGACSSTDSVIVTVLPLPVADAGADVFTTAGTPALIGGSPAGSGTTPPYTYLWTPGSMLSDSLQPNPTATTASTITLSLAVTDSLGCTGVDTMVIYINDPPVAMDDTISILEDSIAVINILQNDSDINNNIDTASISIVVGPFFGSVSVDPISGLVTYTSLSNYNGPDSLQYSICDFGLPVYCDTSWIYINIIPVNDAPVAVDDYYVTQEDACIIINVLTNDFDVENDIDSASFSVLQLPSHGTITLSGTQGLFTYCPDSAYNGNDTLVYMICDNGSPVLCDTAMVVITVQPFDNPPVAMDDTVAICEYQSITVNVLANDFDQEGDSVTVSIITIPFNGTSMVDTSNMISYTPLGSFFGLDSIQYAICENNNPGMCDTAWVWVTVHSLPVLSTTHVNLVCTSDSTGSIDLTVTGVSPFTYLWSNTETTEDIDSLISGTYTVVVVDSFGCGNSITDSVVAPNPLTSSFITSNIKCYGDTSGSIDLVVSGGILPYAFNWSNGEQTEDIDTLVAGIYTVNITDSNGCVLQSIDSITQPLSALSIIASLTNVYCAADSSGGIDITVNGGTPGYIYSWSNGYVSEDLVALTAGNYTVTVTDTNACVITFSDSIASTVPAVNISYVVQDAYCINGTLGAINVTPIGGTLPFTYSWSNADTTEDVINLIGGNYSLNLTDSFNCVYTISAVIQDSSAIAITSTDTVICQGSTIDLIAPVNGAVSYQWLNGIDTIAGGTNATFIADSAGSYTLIATAICGTYTSNAINLTVNAVPVISVSGTIQTTCDSSVTLQVIGGVTYLWLPNASLNDSTIAQPIASPQSTTTYLVIATDSNGCSATASIEVNVNCDSLTVPSGFSPNGDGLNDLLEISDIGLYPGNRLRIFNRWGNIVYDKTNYDNSWNGSPNVNMILKSEMLPEGTYYYVLDLNNDTDMMSGFIVLRR